MPSPLVNTILGLALFGVIACGGPGASPPRTSDGVQPITPPDYTIVEVKDSSFGRVRSRRTVEIEAPTAETHRNQVLAMMAAAVAQYREERPDAVSARLWDTYADTAIAKNRIVYTPDGCGWAGDNCTGAIWWELHRGEIPPDLANFGR